jgi:hypothetical protein
MHISTSINFVNKHKDILFIAEVRGDGGNTTGSNSTSTESYTANIVIVTLVVSILVCLTVVVIFCTCKEIFFHYFLAKQTIN